MKPVIDLPVKQTREFKQFIFSQYLADGLRITLGGLLPSVIFARLGSLETGITFSLAALTVSLADGPGPVAYKRNGMLFCTLFMILTAIITGLINDSAIFLTVEIFLLCFFFSMFNIYGNRAASIGMAALLILVLNIDQHPSFSELLVQIALLLGGCVWYMLFSLSIAGFRPYRLAQQSLALAIREVAGYLRVKSEFYDRQADTENTYKKLITQQITVHEHQDATRELLFKSRQRIKESTSTGRQLVLVFVDIVDLFEQSMATHYDYQAIRKNYHETGALPEIRALIDKLAEELENLSYYVNNNEQPFQLHLFSNDLERLKTTIDKVETDYGANNLVLKKVLINIRNMVNRIQKIYSYFNPNELQQASIRSEDDLPKFVSHQDYDLKLFAENLSMHSTVFRHSLRVALMATIGYLISKAFPIGHHSYWILLTIIVILKPGFSLTKQRNYQRVFGTIIGAAAGMAVLYFVKDHTARFFFLMCFMIGAYTFQRLNYIVSVLFMTPYILIMFSFIGLGGFNIARERIVDTLLGSAIAFTASYFIFPSWEYGQLKRNMRSLLVANYYYLFEAATLLAGQMNDITRYKLARRNVYLQSANMSSSFQRMLAEPKSKQRNAENVHKFVVMNHILSSYTANLIFHLQQTINRQAAAPHTRIARKALYSLLASINELNSSGDTPLKEPELPLSEPKENTTEQNSESRLIEEQLGFVANLAGDIQKITLRIVQR
jgi:uncharacterized membrane protein (TIGR01666 family)